MPKSKFTECFSFFSPQTSNCLSLVPGVWVGYGGVKTLENRSCKFNLLIFSRLPRYVYMDDILSRFKRKERGSSSSDSETSLQGKRVCSQEPNKTDEILVALATQKDIAAKLQQVLDKLGEMGKKIESVMANVASLEKTMSNMYHPIMILWFSFIFASKLIIIIHTCHHTRIKLKHNNDRLISWNIVSKCC